MTMIMVSGKQSFLKMKNSKLINNTIYTAGLLKLSKKPLVVKPIFNLTYFLVYGNIIDHF
jgi:hypothetical protein